MVARSRAANQSHASPIGSILPGFGKVEVFSLPEARRVARFDAAKHPGDLRFLDDAQLWATFEHGRRHFSWDVQKSALLWQQGFPESTSFARVDDRLVHLSRRGKKQFELGTLELRSGRRGKPLVIRQELDDMAAVNRDLAVVGGGGKLTAYDLGTMKPVASATLDAEQIRLQAHRPGGARGDRVELEDLPEDVRQAAPIPIATAGTVRALADVEKDYIIAALELNAGNQTRTAEQLHIGAATLYRKLKSYGLIGTRHGKPT